jgi:hypothetical protein
MLYNEQEWPGIRIKIGGVSPSSTERLDGGHNLNQEPLTIAARASKATKSVIITDVSGFIGVALARTLH